MDSKDWLTAFLGFLLGIPSSIIATWILGSLLPIAAGYHFIRVLTVLRRSIRTDDLFDLPWTQEWDVHAEKRPRSFPSAITVYRFTNLLAAEFKEADDTGRGIYRVVGIIDGNKITGTWKDRKQLGYYGTFQLLISHKRDEAKGKWVGFSAKKSLVRSGNWVWRPQHTLGGHGGQGLRKAD
ncbi:MAG: hypothetical protein GC182_09945 [Rhodopseudomonas sp.]|nr:hypothetical protein [Rhodopseudomonas sp.]